MKRTLLALVALALLAAGCEGRNATAPSADDLSVTPQFQAGGVVHRVSVGGPDADLFGPGTDANFSLIAIEHADGRVTGQWTDQFGHGNNGVHVVVDCVHVVGNQAWISGVANDKTFDGSPVITRVSDNGKSANDPPDQISFSFIGLALSCHDMPPLPLLTMTRGQVTVD